MSRSLTATLDHVLGAIPGDTVVLRWREQRPAVPAQPQTPIEPAIRSCLNRLDIQSLYAHQAKAFDAVAQGEDIVVTCGTDSGKSLCYVLPTLKALLDEPAARALYLFPTKALAQDQLQKLRTVLPKEFHVATYDGDTPTSDRSRIRNRAHIVLSNPDMLHVGILPNHKAWATFLRNLRVIAIDELHALSGIFGSHTALVLRRLLRLCDRYGSRPCIIGTSATIGNAEQLFERLTSRVPRVIDEDGAPRGDRTLYVFNPPTKADGTRESANFISGAVLAALVERGVRTLAFSQSRVSAELVLSYARRFLDDSPHANRVDSYRAGYTADERRNIEARLFHGDLVGLSSTNAMELGVDIGALDVVLMNGYPGSINSLMQQAGRAGRRASEGVAILVARDAPIDQYYVRNPGLLVDAQPESIAIKPENRVVLAGHVRCAAWERPIAPQELAWFPNGTEEVIHDLVQRAELERRASGWSCARASSPAAEIGLRGADAEYLLLLEGVTIGTLEEWRAFTSAHQGAVYLHRGEAFLVQELDHFARTVKLEPFEADYYTRALVQSTVEGISLQNHREALGVVVTLAQVEVTQQPIFFERRRIFDDAVLDRNEIDLPARTWQTMAVMLRFDHRHRSPNLEGDWGAAIHGFEHLAAAFAPLIAECSRSDIGSDWNATDEATITVYDGTPGGVGLSELLFDGAERWLRACAANVLNCACKDGCPGCILSPHCSTLNEELKKEAVRALAESMLRPTSAAR